MPQRRKTRSALVLLVCYLLGSCCCIADTASNDLYKLLGVDRKATIQEIKSAYRRKARDTHPDKNQGVPPQEAAEQFRNVVHAFEILSDTNSRRRYDQTGRQDAAGNNNSNNNGFGNSWSSWQWSSGQQQRGGSFHFQWNHRQFVPFKDRFEVREAMSRVLHVVSLDQLKTIMLDDNDVLERNILICAYTPPLEPHVDNEMVREACPRVAFATTRLDSQQRFLA